MKKTDSLYRGKSTESGEWIYGYFGIKGYGTNLERHVIMTCEMLNNITYYPFYFQDHEIIKGTEGQNTGIKDKTGNDIYEGDILKTKHGICYVLWDDLGWALKSPGSEAIDHDYKDVYESAEVIGNIHENPELL